MIIDITKAIESLKATKPSSTPKKKKTTSKKKQVESVVLGDVNRLASLPDVVSIEFLSGYTDNLDELLYPYVASRMMTLGYASNYKNVIIDNIFGNEHHLGIFHYLQERNTDNLSDKELVAHAERLLVRGWHIRKEGPQYWLVNLDFTKIIELTGKAPLAREVAALVFDESSAHIFLDEGVAARFAALAKTLGHDADELAASGNLDVLLTRVTDNKFGGYVINYTAWRNILKKQTRYPTLTDGFTPLDLYEQGYRLDSRLTYPVAEKAVLMDSNMRRHLIIPVTPDISMETGVNKYQLACIAAKVKQDLLSSVRGVMVQELHEVKELRHTFAIMLDYWDTPVTNVTMTDTSEILHRIQALADSGSLPEPFAVKVLESLAAIFVTEAILLGNSKTTLACVNVDPISGNVYSYNGLEYFSRPQGIVQATEEVNLSNIPLVIDDATLGGLIEVLPQRFLAALAGYEINTDEYIGEFSKVKEYFSQAKAALLGER